MLFLGCSLFFILIGAVIVVLIHKLLCKPHNCVAIDIIQDLSHYPIPAICASLGYRLGMMSRACRCLRLAGHTSHDSAAGKAQPAQQKANFLGVFTLILEPY
jgi:hypothetical protein